MKEKGLVIEDLECEEPLLFRVNTTVAKKVARYRLSFSGCIGGYVGQVGRYKDRGFYFYENVLNLQ